MAGYTVDVDALNDLQSQMQQFLEKATDSLDRVEAQITRVAADWDGAAAQAYQQRHRRWVAALQEMNESVTEFKAWSGAAEEAYRTVMATNLRMAQG